MRVTDFALSGGSLLESWQGDQEYYKWAMAVWFHAASKRTFQIHRYLCLNLKTYSVTVVIDGKLSNKSWPILPSILEFGCQD
jgi:hypothetical protein